MDVLTSSWAGQNWPSGRADEGIPFTVRARADRARANRPQESAHQVMGFCARGGHYPSDEGVFAWRLWLSGAR